MATLLTVFHCFVCVILVLVVLMQSGKDGGMGMMSGGSSQTVFGSSGGADFFTKFTSAMAAIFMVTSIGLTLIKAGHKRSVFEGNKATTTIPAPAIPAAPTPAAPAGK